MYGFIVVAAVIGGGAGLAAAGLHWAIDELTALLTGSADYGVDGRQPNPLVPGLGIWFVVLVPVIGGLIYGPLVARWPEARGAGIAELMLAVQDLGGRMRARVVVVKSIASTVCIGSGGSVGREGPTAQIAGALASGLGQRLGLSRPALRLLVACGVAGGISATFNAPLAGVFFALEIVLRDFRSTSFAMVVVAAIVADAVSQAILPATVVLSLPDFELASSWEYLFFAGLGVAAAIAGVALIRSTDLMQRAVDRVWRGPEWLRPAAGGLLLGALLLALPQLYGIGFGVLEQGVRGELATGLLLALAAGKVVATSLTLAIGGVGGVLAPALFVGGMLGSAYGAGMAAAAPDAVGNMSGYGLVGMGATLAAATRAPITGAMTIFELTADFAVIVPVVGAVALATVLSRLLSRDTVYSLALRNRRASMTVAGAAEAATVRDAMGALPTPLPLDATLDVTLRRFAADGRDVLPVAADDGAIVGIVTAQEAQLALRAGHPETECRELVEPAPALLETDSLARALDLLTATGRSALPVLADDGDATAGWLEHRHALAAYAHHTASTS